MPKQPETIERFRITAEVEKTDMGELLAQLIKLGLTSVHYELITDIINFRRNKTQQVQEAEAPQETLMLPAPEKVHGHKGKPSPRFDVSGEEVIWRHVKNRTRPFKNEELRTLFKAQGREPNSTSPVLDKMMKKGLLERVEAGVFKVASGAKEKMKRHKAAPGTKANIKKPRHAISNRTLIFNHIGDRTTFTAAEIMELFKTEHRPPTSASSLLSVLRTDGYIKSDDEGNYTVLRRPTSKLNGAAAHG